MNGTVHSQAAGRWFAVARSQEVIPRHVVHSQLYGQELAVWRDAAGGVNAWENRCPHRGVRLSLGYNNGTELQCQYHGWRFASGTGQCTHIPAHPAQKPASTIRALTFAVREAGGYVWVCLDTPVPVHAPSRGARRCDDAARCDDRGIPCRGRWSFVAWLRVYARAGLPRSVHARYRSSQRGTT